MDKYDFKILLEQVYDDTLAGTKISDELLQRMHKAFKEDIKDIDSLFGVSLLPDYEGEPDILYVFISDRKTWEEEQRQADFYKDDTASILIEMGLIETEDGIFCQAKERFNKTELIGKLSLIGLTYDHLFETFIVDCMES